MQPDFCDQTCSWARLPSGERGGACAALFRANLTGESVGRKQEATAASGRGGKTGQLSQMDRLKEKHDYLQLFINSPTESLCACPRAATPGTQAQALGEGGASVDGA